MAYPLIVQASAAMFDTIEPDGWTVVFGIYVVTVNGTPVTGLAAENFAVWGVHTISELDVSLLTEIDADFPTSKMPGVYRLQTQDMLGPDAPSERGFVYAVRVTNRIRRSLYQGVTTAPVTYFGKPK